MRRRISQLEEALADAAAVLGVTPALFTSVVDEFEAYLKRSRRGSSPRDRRAVAEGLANDALITLAREAGSGDGAPWSPATESKA